jgi:hypothetical protein
MASFSEESFSHDVLLMSKLCCMFCSLSLQSVSMNEMNRKEMLENSSELKSLQNQLTALTEEQDNLSSV